MKIIKTVLRIIIIAPFIIGLPTGNKILSMTTTATSENTTLSTFESIVAIPGIFGCVAIMVALVLLFIISVGSFFEWVFSSNKN